MHDRLLSCFVATLLLTGSLAGNPVANAMLSADESIETCASDASTIADGSGCFEVPGAEGREMRTIQVHYHRPASFTLGSPVLMVIPGAGRNGEDYRDAWQATSEEYGVLVLSPSFSEKHYPEYWSYNLGNMIESVTLELNLIVDADPAEWRLDEVLATTASGSAMEQLRHGNFLLYQVAAFAQAGMVADIDARATGLTVNRNRSAWIYADLDRIFSLVRESLHLDADTYDLFGHSAGGQVLHRFAMFHPDNRANRIVAANSGWYTLPSFDTEFPYGLKSTGMQPAEIREALQSSLIVLLGEKDDETETRGSLRRSPEANLQGPGRLQRGRYFFEQATQKAEALGTELAWKLEIVPDIGHSYRRMSRAAAEYLYGGRDR